MARPKQEGSRYFPLDVDFLADEKVIPVKVAFGAKGIAVVIGLLCAIYRNGYFAQWGDLLSLKIANDLSGITPQLVVDTVNMLVKYGFFDRTTFDNDEVLTSAAIQRRYYAIKRGRIDTSNLPFWCISETQTPVLVTKTPIMASKTPPINKSKVNKSKIKEKNSLEGVKKEPATSATPKPPHTEDLNKISLEELRDIASMPDVDALYPSEIDLKKFYAYYSARGWMIAPGIPMASVKDALIAWLGKRSRFEDDRGNATAERRRRSRQQSPPDIKSPEPDQQPLRGQELADLLSLNGFIPQKVNFKNMETQNKKL